MRNLNQFMRFDHEAFFKDKKLMSQGVREWKDYDTKEVLGTVIDVVIVSDETEYKNRDGERSTNRFEKFSVKVPQKNLEIPLEVLVQLTGEVRGTVWGEYRNQLSVKAGGIEVVDRGER